MDESVPDDLRALTPGLKAQWLPALRHLQNHPNAPRWNARCGDRLDQASLDYVRRFARDLHSRRPGRELTPALADWIFGMGLQSPYVQQALAGRDWENDFAGLPRLTRADLQSRLPELVPLNQGWEGLVVNPTSGTTGQPILAPNHVRAVGCYEPLLLYILERFGVKEKLDHTRTAGIQLCAQNRTMTYATVHSYSHGAGFAKINLAPGDWLAADDAEAYTTAMAPVFFSGDPFAFLEARRLNLSWKPRLLLSTATTLEPEARRLLTEHFDAPVAELYSLNETGPLAYSCPHQPGTFHVLPHDILLEITDEDGQPVPDGATGEILVTGGRNPFLPLLRYRTADQGRWLTEPCGCGETSPRFELQGRKTRLYTTAAGQLVNSVDLARILRQYPVRQFRFAALDDGGFHLDLSRDSVLPAAEQARLTSELEALLGGPGSLRLTSSADGWEKKLGGFA